MKGNINLCLSLNAYLAFVQCNIPAFSSDFIYQVALSTPCFKSVISFPTSNHSYSHWPRDSTTPPDPPKEKKNPLILETGIRSLDQSFFKIQWKLSLGRKFEFLSEYSLNKKKCQFDEASAETQLNLQKKSH